MFFTANSTLLTVGLAEIARASMDVRPNVGQLEDGPEAAVSNDELHITPEIYHNQFWLDHVQVYRLSLHCTLQAYERVVIVKLH